MSSWMCEDSECGQGLEHNRSRHGKLVRAEEKTNVLGDRALWINTWKTGRQPSQLFQQKTEISSFDLEPYRLRVRRVKDP